MLALAGCASRTPAPVEDRTARRRRRHRAARRGRTPGARARLAAADLHGEARRHAVRDRARPRSRLPRARGLEQHREPEPDPRRAGAAISPRRAKRAPAAAGVATTPLRAPAAGGGDRRRPVRPPERARRHPHRQRLRLPAPRPRTDTLKTQPKTGEGAVLRTGVARAQQRAADCAGRRRPSSRARSRRPLEPRPAPPAGGTGGGARRPRPAPADDAEKIDWVWPPRASSSPGSPTPRTSRASTSPAAPGQPVVASAAGKVVYAGTGLRGYGKLVIVKHNATFLSAYAHNREILVKEGQAVTRGDRRSPKWATPTPTP